MSSEFTKANIDMYLKELAKEYRKQVGKAMPGEIILIGGASVLINYGFRNMTTDIDAIISGASAMKDALTLVRDRFDLPVDWLNSDFMITDSYTPKLTEFSTYYRTFSNVLTVRTVSAEYLIAMKLKSGRQYKNDLSDVLGILIEHQRSGNPITLDLIQKASSDLYGSWYSIPEPSRFFIRNVMERQSEDLEKLYAEIVLGEQETRMLLTDFEENNPEPVSPAEVNRITETLQNNSERVSVISKLRQISSNMNHDNPTKHHDEMER